MTSLFILLAIAGLTVLATLFFRVSSILLFTSVAVGDLLVRYMGDNATLVVATAYNGSHDDVIARLGLLLLPVVCTLLFCRHSLSRAKVVLHMVPIVASSVVLALLVLVQLPGGFQNSVYSSSYGTQIRENQDLAIASAGVASLVVAWLTTETHKARRSKKH